MAQIKNREFIFKKMSELFKGDIIFRDVEQKQVYQRKDEYYYLIKLLIDNTDEIVEVTMQEAPNPTFKRGDKVDFAEFKYTIKGKGVSAYGTNIMADIVETFEAEKIIKADTSK